MITNMMQKNETYLVVLAALLAVLASPGCGTPSLANALDGGDAATSAAVERGRYLVSTSGCNDCHTPFIMTERGPEPDMTRMLTGHPESIVLPMPPQLPEGPWSWMGAESNTAFAGAWGVSYAKNLTPDDNTGIGIWTEDMFLRAIRTGRHMGVSRPIMPPMPWQVYRQMTDEDLKAIYAFLRTLPPTHNRVPEPLEPHEVAALR